MDWLSRFSEIIQTGPKLDFQFGGISFTPSYLNAGIIVVLLFVLVLTLAQVRRHFMDWSVKGSLFGLFLGFLLALILEGFLVIGGRTAVTEILGWKNPPKPVLTALEWGRNRVVKVLGANTQISFSKADQKPTTLEVLTNFKELTSLEKDEVAKVVCQP